MSNMKCPVCKGELHIFKSSTQDAIVCADCGFDGNTKLWQGLIRTRKALEIAVDALKDIRCVYTGDQTTKPSTMFGRAASALNKIQELEQITAEQKGKEMTSCCDKAIDNGTLVYKGRATIVCPTCGKDQMLKLV